VNIKQACVLAVGTELSTGQIINSNAAWISQQLTEQGIQACWHLTVADHRASILVALEQANNYAELVFVTGGLGPTSDDFTREVIAQWLDLPLEFDQASWLALEARAEKLNFKLSHSQKQQCYFPKGAQILSNPAGTANAFSLAQTGRLLIVLPGPPSEIQAIWQTHLNHLLSSYLPGKSKQKLYRWQCMGLPEGDLGEKVEEILQGSGFQTGYRVHFPYIEVKVWIGEEQSSQPWLDKLDNCLKPWTLLRDDEDMAELFLNALPPDRPVRLIDTASKGLLAQRLQPLLSARTLNLIIESHYQQTDTNPVDSSKDEVYLSLQKNADGGWAIGMNRGSQQKKATLLPRYPIEMTTRNQPYLVERALEAWLNWLR
jgi:nicotinamide-nucleotide amidase